MLSTRIHGDVTYYDQLGVARNATAEQIRHAYRSLVRILHPDQQQDPELKAAAERQLRKLNRIHSTLIDPDKRRVYDQYLAEEVFSDAVEVDDPRLQLRKNLIRAGWIVGAILSVVLLFWLGSESSPVESFPPQSRVAGPKPETQARDTPNDAGQPKAQPSSDPEVELLRRELAMALSERDDALREAAALRSRRTPFPGNTPGAGPANGTAAPPQSRSAVPVMTELPSAASSASSSGGQTQAPKSAPVRQDAAKTRKLAGAWFYVRPKEGQQNKNRALYPPEFIEITISGENASLRGRYRARYRILDRPISPDVNFEFSGKEASGTCLCNWRGIGGARGQITLQLTGDNTMRFDWSASELGSQQGLASGTAVLARRPDSP